MGQLWAVLLRMKTVGSAPDEKSLYGVANKRDGCTMVSFSRSKGRFRLTKAAGRDCIDESSATLWQVFLKVELCI
jgi:hypothetical protein